MFRPILLLPILALGACGDGAQTGTDVRIRDENGNVVAGIDGETGEVTVDVPGFEGAIKLPKLQIDAADFDLNGVKLYPGSTIDSMSVTDGEGGLRLRFTSPAAAATVCDWLGERLRGAGYALQAQGDALAGTTEDGKPFRLEMRPQGEGASAGVITIG